jgi:hypothetical protein
MSHEVLLRTSDGRRRFLIDDDFIRSLSVPIGVDNFDTVELFIASWIALLADSPLNPDDKPAQLYRRFLNRIRRDGVQQVVLDFSALSHKLVSQHMLMGTASSIGDWIDDFKDTPVFFEYHRYFETEDVSILRFLYTFLNFGKKLEFVDEAFNSVAFRGWADVEKELSDLTLPEEDVAAMRQILKAVLPKFSFEDFRPKFGPGAVQERGVRGRLGKIRHLQYDPIIDRFMFHGHAGMYGYGEDLGLTADKVIPDPYRWTPARGISSRVSLLRFVPKNLRVSRSICMEPNTLMFFQQGVEREMLRLLDSSVLHRFIDIRNQQRNQDLACYGSFTAEIDTLDLSSASDSVSLDLVRKIFPASWLLPMLATRSHSVQLPDGSYHRMMKFAPMGSALCFPTQCIIFTCVCIYAASLRTYEIESSEQSFLDWLPKNLAFVIDLFNDECGGSRVFQPLAVYGDDICIDSRLTDIVKSILARLGFRVNHDKSFTGSQSFRESCGGFFLSGHDITPLLFRVEGARRLLTPACVASLVHLINGAYQNGMRTLYRFGRQAVMTWGIGARFRNKASTQNPIPYVSNPDAFGILCRDPLNSHVKKRHNTDYQRDEIKVWTISYEESCSPGELLSSVDKYEYTRWWTGRAKDETDGVKPVSRYDHRGSRLRWSWIPA